MDNLRKKFAKIYDQNIEKIYRFIFLKVNSQETAEDLSSKVFLKGWEAYIKIQNPKFKIQNSIDNPRAFLYQIARNAVVDYYREKGRTQVISTDLVPQMSDPKTNLEEKAVLNSDLEMIKRALKDLNDDYQNVIIWHYLNDLSIYEIAKIQDKPEGNVRVTLHRALKSLKQKIDSV